MPLALRTLLLLLLAGYTAFAAGPFVSFLLVSCIVLAASWLIRRRERLEF